MSWFFSLSKAYWTLEEYSERVGMQEYYDYMAWVLKESDTGAIVVAIQSKNEYDEQISKLKKRYSFRDLAPDDWKNLKDKQEIYAATRQLNEERRDTEAKARDIAYAKTQELKRQAELEKKKTECRALLATGGRRRRKRKSRRKTYRKK